MNLAITMQEKQGKFDSSSQSGQSNPDGDALELQLFARYFVEKPPTVATRLLCMSLLSKRRTALRVLATHSPASARHGEARADVAMDTAMETRTQGGATSAQGSSASLRTERAGEARRAMGGRLEQGRHAQRSSAGHDHGEIQAGRHGRARAKEETNRGGDGREKHGWEAGRWPPNWVEPSCGRATARELGKAERSARREERHGSKRSMGSREGDHNAGSWVQSELGEQGRRAAGLEQGHDREELGKRSRGTQTGRA